MRQQGRVLPMLTTTAPDLSAPHCPRAQSASEGRPWPALRVRLALAAGLAALAGALGLVLSSSPLTAAGSNGVPAHIDIGYSDGNKVTCQAGGTIPAGTDAIRLSLSANNGPRVGVKVLDGQSVISEGARDGGWGIDETVTVPVRRVAQTIHGAGVCVAIGTSSESVLINGEKVRTPSGRAGELLRMEYLRPGPRSWLSLAPSIARDMGFARAPSGAWVAYLAIAVMLAVCALASRLVLAEAGASRRRVRTSGVLARRLGSHGGPLRRIPRAAWTCALVATLSAACWSVITPPFQGTDEPSHFAYAQHLAETGSLPNPSVSSFSQQEEAIMHGLHQSQVQWHPEVHTVSTQPELAQLRERFALPLSSSSPAGAGVATSEPPLYYALQTIPYYLGSPGTLLDQLELMRLESALMAGVTALFVFLFVRELLPAARWAWTVGGLGAALFPLLGFTSSFVTPDAMLCAVSAAIFYCLARAFRQGLTRRSAIVIGVLSAVGMLTKLNFIGLAPGVMLGLLVLALRRGRDQQHAQARRHALASVAIAVAIAMAPAFVYLIDNAIKHHHTLGIVSIAAHVASNKRTGVKSLLGDISYIWQLYLPRLPGMAKYFPGISTTRDLWFDRFVGLYGWLDTSFPVWVDNLALIPAGLIALLALRTLMSRRAALRGRLGELLVYLVIGAGLMTLLAQAAHLNDLSEPGWAQPRYLLPLLPLGAALLAIAARGAGRRWGPAVGALIVVLFLAHDIFSQLLVVSRYYG